MHEVESALLANVFEELVSFERLYRRYRFCLVFATVWILMTLALIARIWTVGFDDVETGIKLASSGFFLFLATGPLLELDLSASNLESQHPDWPTKLREKAEQNCNYPPFFFSALLLKGAGL